MAKSQSAVLEAIRDAVLKRTSEQSQLTAVAKVLAIHGGLVQPKVRSTKDAAGGTVRLYVYEKTSAGDFVLVTGPSIEPEVKPMGELAVEKAPKGFYVEVGAGSDRDDARIAAAVKSAHRVAKSVAKAPAVRAERKPSTPKAKTVSLDEGVRLWNALSAAEDRQVMRAEAEQWETADERAERERLSAVVHAWPQAFQDKIVAEALRRERAAAPPPRRGGMDVRVTAPTGGRGGLRAIRGGAGGEYAPVRLPAPPPAPAPPAGGLTAADLAIIQQAIQAALAG
jgi:hypothetical protein